MIRAHGRRPFRPRGYFRCGPNDMERGSAWFVFPRRFWPLADTLRLRRAH
jgi:hypothetical protein